MTLERKSLDGKAGGAQLCHFSNTTHPSASLADRWVICLHARVDVFMPGYWSSVPYVGPGNTCLEFHKNHSTTSQHFMQSSFWSCFLKNLGLLCLILPYFHKGFILWQILRAYITIYVEKEISQNALPSILLRTQALTFLWKCWSIFFCLDLPWFWVLAGLHLVTFTWKDHEDKRTSLWDSDFFVRQSRWIPYTYKSSMSY